MFNSYPSSRKLGQLLTDRSWRIALVESCTAGLVANNIVRVSGASAWFECSFVTYSDESKIAALGISKDLLDDHGAVSPEVAKAMAEGCLAHSTANIALSISGVAGPGGGTDLKPVGTVFMGLSLASGESFVRRYHLTGGRRQIQKHASELLLAWACEHLSAESIRPLK